MAYAKIYIYYISVVDKERNGYTHTHRIEATSKAKAIEHMAKKLQREGGNHFSSMSIGDGIPRAEHDRQKTLRMKKAQRERRKREALAKISVYDGTTRIR